MDRYLSFTVSTAFWHHVESRMATVRPTVEVCETASVAMVAHATYDLRKLKALEAHATRVLNMQVYTTSRSSRIETVNRYNFVVPEKKTKATLPDTIPVEFLDRIASIVEPQSRSKVAGSFSAQK